MPRYEHDEEKRRAKREAAEQKRREEAKRIRRNLFVALIALVLCGVAIRNLTREVKADLASGTVLSEEETVETTSETKPTSPIQKDPITTIHIKAAGDLNVTDSVINAGVAVGGFDFNPVFQDVASILADADLTVMNFEGNVCGEPYGTATTSAPIELIQGLRNCGVDLLQMANSCAINNGLNGLTATLQAIRSTGIEPLGAYATETELRTSKGYTITEVQGIKVAFVAFTKGLGGRGMPAGNEELVNLLYEDYSTEYRTIHEERITTILKNVETEKPDITIALLHWGSEYNDDISSGQKRIVSIMQKNGVDVIVGTHPHTLQPIVFDEMAGTLVVYSLGDFFGDAQRGATNYSIILDIEITKDDNTGLTKVTDYSYTPIFTVRENESIGTDDRRVVRIDKAIEANQENFLDRINDTTKDSMVYALKRIGERVAVEKEVKCPGCKKDVTIFVNKTGSLVTQVTCKCGEVLPSGSDLSDYD